MLRVAIAQFRPRKGAYEENLERVGELFRGFAASPAPPDLVVFPEAALTGYFLEGGVQEFALPTDRLFDDLARVHQSAGAPPLELVIGFYETFRARLYNSALAASLGGPDAGVRHVHRKIFLPTYGVFDEERFVEPGLTVEAYDARFGRAAVIICEDAWHSLVPTIAALDGAQLLVVPGASPARGLQPDEEGDSRPGSTRRWERTVQSVAAEHGVYMVVAQLAGFEGGKALQGGSSVVGPRGEVLARGPLFEEALVEVEIDLEEIARARAESPLLSDLEMRLPHLVRSLEPKSHNGHGVAVRPPLRERPVRAPQRSRAEKGGDPLAIDPELARTWLVEFIRDEVQRRRGFDRVVVGVSGGVDSALVLMLAAQALGGENVSALRMPYRTSSRDSLEHAALVIERAGAVTETIDITAGVDGLSGALADRPDPRRLGNVCARMRMIALFDRSAALHALPLGTGNKSERLLGYFTWHADDSPPVNPLGDLFKTQVWALARHVGVPDVIVDKPATADLVSGQTDEGDFGISYGRADLILHWLLLGHRPEEIAELGFTAAEIALVRDRLESTHWKRKLPTVAMMSQTAIGEYYLRPVDY